MRWLSVALICAMPWISPLAHGVEKMGVLLMHGKQGGGVKDTSLDALHRKMQAAGMQVIKPELPWSFNRYIDGDWDLAMAEVNGHVQRLKEMGAQRIALVGHSLGSPAALSYAVRFPTQVHALGLLAPGHVPHYYSLCIPYSPIRMCGVKEGVEQARQEVLAGRADKKQPLVDINQGRRNAVWMTPRDYLTYFDPASDAEMSVTAPRMPPGVPVLWAIGDGDYLVREGRQYVFDLLPPHPRSLYLQVSGNHLSTPAVAADQVVDWLKQVLSEP